MSDFYNKVYELTIELKQEIENSEFSGNFGNEISSLLYESYNVNVANCNTSNRAFKDALSKD